MFNNDPLDSPIHMLGSHFCVLIFLLVVDGNHILLVYSLAGKVQTRVILKVRLMHEGVITAVILELLGKGVLNDAAHTFKLPLQVPQLQVARAYRLL